jgi:hypothetical protein
MNRTQSLAAALAAACIAAGGVTSSASAAPAATPLDDLPLPLNLERVTKRLTRLGLTTEQITEVTAFLALDAAKQKEVLAAAGIDDAGGDLADPSVGDYVLGQYLTKKGVDPKKTAVLQLSSGKMKPDKALALGQTLSPADVPVTADEISQQAQALGIDRKTAEVRARLQRTATLLRPYLAQLVPETAAVWIEDKGQPHLVISVAGGVDKVARLLAVSGRQAFAGTAIQIRPVKASKATLAAMVASVRAELAAEAPGAKVEVSADPTTSQVHVRGADAASDKKVRAARSVVARVKAGDAVFDAPKAVGPQAVLGGHGTQSGGCTWGFTGVQGNTKVLSGAGHCSGASGYGTLVATTLLATSTYYQVDASKHTSSSFWYSEYDNFVERTGLPNLEITSRTPWASTDYLDVVCHQGAVSGHSCGWVTSVFYSPSWVGNGSSFVQVESPTLNVLVGDSGGPWFYGNSAYGIHTGGYNGYGTSEVWGLGVFGSINFAETNVHFTVMTK